MKSEKNIEQQKEKTGERMVVRRQKRQQGSHATPRTRHVDMMSFAKPADMPAWMDCTWKRVSCGRDDCPMCGRINRDYDRHVENGEDPDDPQVMMEDVADALRETMVMIKKHAAEMDIDFSIIDDVEYDQPPSPKTFLLYRSVMAWSEDLNKSINEAELNGAYWPYTEEAEDLNWYKNTLCSKVYRQLCNRWRMDRGEEFASVDYEYTHRVLHECCWLLCRALIKIASPEDPLRQTAATLLQRLNQLEEKILEI